MKTAQKKVKPKEINPIWHKLYWVAFAAIIIYGTINIFYDIGNAPIRNWDEARHGVSAYEMIRNNEYIVHTYNGAVDYWNLKPPMSFWPIVLGYKIFGLNEFGFRFFSALCVPIICAVSMLFLKKEFGRITSLTAGFLFADIADHFLHLFYNGDADAVFNLFCFLSYIFLYQGFVKVDKYFLGAGFFAALAFLTKASHVFVIIFVPVALCFLILLIKYKKNPIKGGLYFLGAFTVPVGIWMLLRARYDGVKFIWAMFEHDVLGRVTSGLENNTGGPFYYLIELYYALGGAYLIAFFVAMIFLGVYIFRHRNSIMEQEKVFILLFSLLIIVPYTLYTLVTTKLPWYTDPATIGFIFLIAWLIGRLTDDIIKKRDKNSMATIQLFIISLTAVFGILTPVDRDFLNYYSDYNSKWPYRSIFYDMEAFRTEGENRYFVVNTDGSQGEIWQGWVLSGIFNEFIFQAGDLSVYSEGKYDHVFLLVIAGEDSELEEFEKNNSELKRIVECDMGAVYQ